MWDTDLGDIGWSDAPRTAYETYCKTLFPNLEPYPWKGLPQHVRRAWAEAFWAANAVHSVEENDE